MRILQCLTTAEIGGTELSVLDLVEELRQAGVAVDVCAVYPPGPLTRRFAAIGVEVRHLGRTRRISPATIARFVGLLRARRYDLLHLYGARVNLLGRVAAKLVGGRRGGAGPGRPKVVAGLRGLFPADRDSRAVLWLDRATVRWVDAYISNSRAAIDYLVARGYPPHVFRWVPSGIRVEAFGQPVDRTAVLGRVGVEPGGRPVLISVANLRSMKGHALLLAALGRLCRAGRDCVAVLVGEGPLRGTLAAQARREGLGERVVFAGAREDVAEYLAAADVFALASTWEGLPRAVLEAMASGLPVVATAVGGVGELVEDGKTGFLVPPGDADALAGRLEALLANPGLRAELGARGRARAQAAFSVEQMVTATEAVYRELVEPYGPPT